jgi:hypothetical protein
MTKKMIKKTIELEIELFCDYLQQENIKANNDTVDKYLKVRKYFAIKQKDLYPHLYEPINPEL